MNELNEFSFEEYDTDKLKVKQDVELLKENIETPNPALAKEKEKDKSFVDIDKYVNDLDFVNEAEGSYSNPNDTPPISMPYDASSGNSYLSLVLSPNLKELEMMIRGLEYVKQRNKFTGKDEYILRKIPGHPLNEYGINQILTHIKIYASPEIKLGRKSSRDYYLSIKQVGRTITRLIYKNLKNFGMDTQEKQRNAKPICLAIIELIDSAYSRSIAGKENDLSRATSFEISGSVDGINDPAGRMFGTKNKNALKN